MADRRNIQGQQLGLLGDNLQTPPFLISVATNSTDSTYTLVDVAQFQFRVLDMWGVMSGAGGASDTIVLKNNTDAITDTVDVSALSDKEIWRANTIDDAYHLVAKGGSLKLTTASAALSFVYILCARA